LYFFGVLLNKLGMRPKKVSTVTFTRSFNQAIRPSKLKEICREHGPVPRGGLTLQLHELIKGLVFHFFKGSGNLAANVATLIKKTISDAALSQRRVPLPWQLFEEILAVALAPKADPQKHPESFYKGFRLIAMDGTKFSVGNTPQILSRLSKAAARRMKAAFAKLGACVLVELGLHNPIAAALGQHGESEIALAVELLSQLPEKSLLLLDRLYGVGAHLAQIVKACQSKSGHVLARARLGLKAKVLELYPDGSARVEIKLREKGKKNGKVIGHLEVREIRGRVKRGNQAWVEVRFWTDLMDWERCPAAELLKLYASRWEHELYYKELKIEMRQGELLNSHTVETAAQEVAALLIASSLIVEERIRVAAMAETTVLRISFGKTLHWVRSLWCVLEAGEGVLSAKQVEKLTRKTLKQIAVHALPARRQRSCPRKVRQPVGSWPRLLENSYEHGESEYEISPIFTA
jgi:Transposase DDE domain